MEAARVRTRGRPSSASRLQPGDQGGPGGRVARPHLAQQHQGGPVVAERGLPLGHRTPFGVLVLLVAVGAGQLEAFADVRAEDGDLRDAGPVLGLLEEPVEQIAEFGGEGVRAAVEGGQCDEERLVPQVDRRLVLLEPLLDLVLQRHEREPRHGVLGHLPGRVPPEQPGEGGDLAQLVAAVEEFGDVGETEQLGGALLVGAGAQMGGEDVGRGRWLPADGGDVLQRGAGADGDHQVGVLLDEAVPGGEQVGFAQRAVPAGGEVAQDVPARGVAVALLLRLRREPVRERARGGVGNQGADGGGAEAVQEHQGGRASAGETGAGQDQDTVAAQPVEKVGHDPVGGDETAVQPLQGGARDLMRRTVRARPCRPPPGGRSPSCRP